MANITDIDIENIKHKISSDDSVERLDRLERIIDIERKRDSFICPSGTISKELCTYSVQLGFSVTILGFCFYNLTQTQNFHDLSVSLISMLIGVYLPQPKMRDD